MPVDAAFWRGKRVLLTGHTGFKGAWLSIWLHRLGAEVTGVALPPATRPSLFERAGVAGLVDDRRLDIRDAEQLGQLVDVCRPEIVLHLAAQALVRPSYARPLETFSTNVMGTANLLEAVRLQPSVRVVVAVTTDKVYRNREWAYPYREDDALGGHDPYSASKAAAEMVVASYRSAFLASAGTALASARAGNVIGGGDWSEDRLLPDAVRAWSAGRVLQVRHPGSVRPWQHVVEPLSAYLRLAEQLWATPTLAGAYNFGPATGEAVTVGRLVQCAQAAFGRGASALGTEPSALHEAGALMVEIAKARTLLGICPQWPFGRAVQHTMDWYRGFADGVPARQLCMVDLDAYASNAPPPDGPPRSAQRPGGTRPARSAVPTHPAMSAMSAMDMADIADMPAMPWVPVEPAT